MARRVALAESMLARGEAAGAESAFRSVLALDPDLDSALLGRAVALHALGRGAEAASPLLRAAERRVRRGADVEAISLLEAATVKLPPDAALLTMLGDARLRARQFLAAEDALGRAASLGPPSSRTLHLLAAAQWENGKIDDAERTYRELLDADGSDAEAWFQLGRLLLWQGRFAAALECFDHSAGLGQGGPDLLVERARALDGASEGGDVEVEAVVRAYAAASAAAPDDYQVRYGWAKALRRAGALEEAARESREFERLYQEHQERTRRAGLERARIDLARKSLRDGQPEEAIRALDDVADTTETHHLRALALIAGGETVAARAELEAALRLEPERTDLRSLLTQLRIED